MHSRRGIAFASVALAAIGAAGAQVAGMSTAPATSASPSPASDSSVSASPSSASPGDRVIRIVAKKFVFSPSEIVLRKGQPVTFELTTLDFGHGFKVPELDFRADFVPDTTTTVRLTPQKAGKFEFLCDNFCGSGHEEMDGHLIVEE